MIALPYIFIVIFFYIMHYFSNLGPLEKYESKYITLFILILFFCFRGYVFTDVFSYKPFFDYVPNLQTGLKTNFITRSWWEPGFTLYCSLIKTFTTEYLVFQAIDTLINIILLYKCLEYFDSVNPNTFMVFMAFSGMILFFDTLRNIKAILIFFYAIRFIAKRKFFPYCLCCLLAVSFHISAVLYFVCYFILRIEFKKRTFIVLCVLSVLSVFISRPVIEFIVSTCTDFLPERLSRMVSAYVLSQNEMSASRLLSFGVIEKFLTVSLICFNFNQLYSKKTKYIVNVYLIYFISYFVLFGFNEISKRVSDLFSFSYWILIPKILSNQKRNNQYLLSIVILTYCVLKMSLYNQNIQRYENSIFGMSSYEERLEMVNEWVERKDK